MARKAVSGALCLVRGRAMPAAGAFDSRLAVKGAALPALSHAQHDPHHPFGRSTETRDVVVPAEILPVVDGLLSALAERDRRIEDLEARLGLREAKGDAATAYRCDAGDGAFPFILSFLNRCCGAGAAAPAVTLAVKPVAQGAHALLVNITMALPVSAALTRRLGAVGHAARRTLDLLALEEYQLGRLTRGELRRIVGLSTRAALSRFLQAEGLDDIETVSPVA